NSILEADNTEIKNNEDKLNKILWSENQVGEKINYFKGSSERDKALFITEKIQILIENQEYSPNDIAILYRTNAQSRAIEDTFMKSNISYQMIGGQRFYDRKE